MLGIITLIKLLGFTPLPPCQSTIFGYPGDKWAGGNTIYYKRPIKPGDVGIAHRRLPIGSIIAIQNLRTKKVAIGKVVDRGPYGAVHKGAWVLKRKRHEVGKWRGCADLTPTMARLIGHDGFDRVVVWRLRRR